MKAKSILAAGALSLALADPADAQLRRQAAPSFWTSLSVGIGDLEAVNDGRTGSAWGFGQGIQYRGSFTWAVQRTSGFGIAASWSRMPLTYVSNQALPGQCAQCDADADVLTAMAVFHTGGREGFHQVIEAGAGIVQYSRFRSRDGAALPPERDTDFAFVISYGFGFGISDRTHLTIVQDWGASFHQSDGLPAGTNRLAQHRTTRFGVRLGMGAQPLVR